MESLEPVCSMLLAVAVPSELKASGLVTYSCRLNLRTGFCGTVSMISQ